MTEKTAGNRSSMRHLAVLLRPHRALFAFGTVFLLFGTIVNLTIPELLRELLNRYGLPYVSGHLWSIGFVATVLFILQGICFYGRTYLFGFLGQRVAAALRRRLYESIVAQPVDFYDVNRTADLVSRLTADAASIQDAISIRLSVLLRYALQVLLGVILMAVLSPLLTLIVVAVLLCLVGISVLLGKSLRRASRAQQEALGAASVVAQETFAAARVVKAFGRESSELARFEAHNDSVLRRGLERTKISAFFQSFVSSLLNTALAFLVLYGVYRVTNGGMTSGDLTAFLAYGAIVAVSFSFIASSYAELVQAFGATARVFDILEEPRDVAVPAGGYKQAAGAGEIRFENVSFAYPSRPDLNVLRGVTFEVPHAASVALVGPSGAGKSTIVNLLLRFYDPGAGRVLLNGVDLREVDPAELRRVISYVPQEPELFGVSIEENLRYGKPDATPAEIQEVSRRAGISEFVERLPHGLATVVGERGAQLSGGQKQRIAIARAMLRNPEILLLDEATSALDSENEALVQQALAELLKGRTSIVIAHRLSTIKGASKVIVLDHGRVVQSGTHDELARQPGLYRALVERQELRGAA